MKKAIIIDGLTLLYRKNKQNKATYCEFGIKCGALCDKIAGTAHYLEHMFFYETLKRKKEEIDKEKYINRINAFTSFNELQITFDQSSKLLEHCFDVCSDMLFNSNISKENVSKEFGPINAEINKNNLNLNKEKLRLLHNVKLYNNKKFSLSPTGTNESIEKITPKILLNFKEKYFYKENFSVTIYTNKSLHFVKKLIKKYILPNLKSKNEKVLNTSNLEFTKKSFIQIIKNNMKDSSFILNLGRQNLEKNTLSKLKQAQTFHFMKSLFNKKLREVLRENNSFIYSLYDYDYRNKFEFLYGIKTQTENKNLIPCLVEISKVLKDIYKNGFSKEDFDDFVQKQKLTDDMDYITPASAISDIKNMYRLYGCFLKQKLIDKSFYSITLKQVNNLFKEIFSKRDIFLSIMTNADKKDLPTLKQIEKIFNE
ncbi:MAG: insulinase family protein [Clostridia bacterium]|nr:insulinase family protein [Clostridia bacterium]